MVSAVPHQSSLVDASSMVCAKALVLSSAGTSASARVSFFIVSSFAIKRDRSLPATTSRPNEGKTARVGDAQCRAVRRKPLEISGQQRLQPQNHAPIYAPRLGDRLNPKFSEEPGPRKGL